MTSSTFSGAADGAGFGRDVSPGDPWRPESAARYNAVNELLARLENSAPEPTPAPRTPGTRIIGVNNSEETEIPAGSPVKIGDAPTGIFENEPEWLPVLPAAMGDSVWGVCRETLKPGECGSVIVSGIAFAAVSGAPDTHVTVGDDGLQYAPSGRAEVLWNDEAGNALLLLGGGGASVNCEGSGYFNVQFVPDPHNPRFGTVRVVDAFGRNPDVCGPSDLGDIPILSIPVRLGTGNLSIWLSARVEDDTIIYSVATSGSDKSWLLAQITPSGEVLQVWQSGIIYWGTRFFI